MYLFYAPDISVDSYLPEQESAHCVRVLRYKIDDTILITDGKGITYTAKITDANAKRCVVSIISQEKQQKKHGFHLHIGIAPPKNIERMEWMVEKCTEIGIDEITPLHCRFSERNVLRNDRLEKIIHAACKQSLNPFLPKLNEMTDYQQFISQDNSMCRFIAHCYAGEKSTLKDALKFLRSEHGRIPSITLLIGPEGDFSEDEVKMATMCGYTPVSLGKSRLRTETAAVVACHTAILFNE